MPRFAALVIVAFLAVALLTSCEKITPPATGAADFAAKLESIPASYGELEAVTAVPEYPGWFQLWFQDSVGTIRLVRIQTTENLIHKQIEVIPRSGAAPMEGM